jgi:hypothetical protein
VIDAGIRASGRSKFLFASGVSQTVLTRAFSVLALPWVQCLGFAMFSAVTFETGMPAQRIWAAWALGAYLLGAGLLASAPRSRWAVGAVAFVALVCPLVQLSVEWQGQHEIWVVQHAAERLVNGIPLYGTEPATLADVNGYFPYLPAMALFGIPGVLARGVALPYPLTDVRWTFVAVYAVVVVVAIRDYRGDRGLAALWLLASPIATLPLATGGDDLPVIGMMLLALTQSMRGRAGAAGFAAGFACAAKLTAWPLGLALVVMTVVRRGPAAAGRFVVAALVMMASLVLPAAISEPRGIIVHQLAFPAGLTSVRSAAHSPSVGRALTDSFADGHLIALCLLVVAGTAYCFSLLARPPADECTAALQVAAGLAVAMMLLPASRVGYLVYPFVLVLFAIHTRHVHRRPAPKSNSRCDALDPYPVVELAPH